MPAASELVAHGRSEAEIAAEIGVDWLVYQDLEDLIESAREGNPGISRFDCSVFNGQYVTNDVDHSYFERLESARGQNARPRLMQAGEDVLGLYNSSRSQP